MVDCIVGYVRKIGSVTARRGKITRIFRTDPETPDLFHTACHSLSFNPEHIKYQFLPPETRRSRVNSLLF